jgi:hypothetical protein
MQFSATYLCPVKGLAGLEPPEPFRLGQAAKTAASLGIERLFLPVLEESLLGSPRSRIHFLDGLVSALDQLTDARCRGWLIAPAQRILGIDWTPPYLVAGFRDPAADPVFVEGRPRNLRPFNWWADPAILEKRIALFRELVAVLTGHPGLGGWVIMDRALQWVRPNARTADLLSRSLSAEVRERDENGVIYMAIEWRELLDPEMVRGLARGVDGLKIGGLDRPPAFDRPVGLSGEFLLATFLGLISQWLFGRPTEFELGWQPPEADDPDELAGLGKDLARMGVAGAVWQNLVDPEPGPSREPPWSLREGYRQGGLLTRALEPKRWVTPWLDGLREAEPKEGAIDFIDLSPEEYLTDPRLHLSRLWRHFRDSVGV